jgi:hypothetical protein
MKIVYRFLNQMVDNGEMVMAWCSEKNDFVFIPVLDKENKKKRKNKKK